MSAPSPLEVEQAYREACERRRPWEPLWRECFAYAAPLRAGALDGGTAARTPDDLYDGTAGDAVAQLAASLLAELAPPWSRWFEIVAGNDVDDATRSVLAPELERATRTLEAHFARSELYVELHQCLLDLVTAGTATLLVREAPVGAPAALRFTAVPLAEMFVLGDGDGRITRQFRRTFTTLARLRRRFPETGLPPELARALEEEPGRRVELVEAVVETGRDCRFLAFLPGGTCGLQGPFVLAEGCFARSPFLTFRWLKAAGEVYGRSPVMTALPDIRTANRVVELILKNASIAVTGIWLADDDGVLNPANIDLSPGSIIPKAPGSAGLTPLQAPGRFDVSQLVLSDLRAAIRHALLVDRLGPVDGPRMTATEVLERSAEMARLLGAIYGRLEGELLRPLIDRAWGILRRRGLVPDLPLDGHALDVAFRTPLAREHAREDVRNVLLWLETVGKLGAGAAAMIDTAAAVRWLAERLGVPAEFVRDLPAELLAAAPAGEERR